MNEARLSGPVIDRDTAAALMAPLTDLGDSGRRRDSGGQPRWHESRRQAGRIAGDGSGSWPPTGSSARVWRGLLPPSRRSPKSALHLARPPYRGSFFLIDPLDGTKEYVAGRSEFTVNLALVTDGTPLLGIIGAPALGLIWRGLVGQGAERLATSGSVKGPPSRSAPGASRKAAPPGSRPSAARMAMPNRGLYRRPAGRGPAGTRFGGQIRPGRGGARRYLSATCPHLRMGYRGRPCHRHRGRRQDHRCAGRRFALRPGPRSFVVPAFIAWGDRRHAKLTGSGILANAMRRHAVRFRDPRESGRSAANRPGYSAGLCSACRPAQGRVVQHGRGFAAKASRLCSRPNR